MKKRFFLSWLAICFLLTPVSRTFAAEQAGEQKTAVEIQVSVEDQQVIALMELLQQMDMLRDLDLMTAGEVKE